MDSYWFRIYRIYSSEFAPHVLPRPSRLLPLDSYGGSFSLLWMATVGAALTAPFALQGGIITVQAGSSVIQIPEATVQRFAVSSYAMTAVYDALVVVAITYQLFFSRLRATPASEATGVSPKPVISYLKSLIRGEGLGKMSKTLLQTGLLYYLCVPSFPTQ